MSRQSLTWKLNWSTWRNESLRYSKNSTTSICKWLIPSWNILMLLKKEKRSYLWSKSKRKRVNSANHKIKLPLLTRLRSFQNLKKSKLSRNFTQCLSNQEKVKYKLIWMYWHWRINLEWKRVRSTLLLPEKTRKIKLRLTFSQSKMQIWSKWTYNKKGPFPKWAEWCRFQITSLEIWTQSNQIRIKIAEGLHNLQKLLNYLFSSSL